MNDILEHRRGLLGTLFIHAVVIALLLFFGFRTPLPLPAEQGILVNFGTDENGSGPVEPSLDQVAAQQETVQPKTPEGNLTQDYEEAPAIEKKETKKPVQKQKKTPQVVTNKEKKTTTEEPKVNPKALYTGRKTEGGESSSEGETTGTGNQGVLNGSPEATVHGPGGGTGNSGISFSLAGRGSLSLPAPEYSYQVEGKVVVEVLVDREGNVISATPGVKGSTTLNKNLLNAAKKAALTAKFNRKPDAPAAQKGTITYHFILQ